MKNAAYIVALMALIGFLMLVIPPYEPEAKPIGKSFCDLQPAMRKAATGIDAGDGEFEKSREAYIEILQAGIFVASGYEEYRDLTIQFSENISDLCRDDWLRGAMMWVKDTKRSDRAEHIHNVIDDIGFTVHVIATMTTLETVCNLADDDDLRATSLEYWNAENIKWHNFNLKEYDRHRADAINEGRQVKPNMPLIKSMPEWGLP